MTKEEGERRETVEERSHIPAELVCSEFLETRHNASAGGDGQKLYFHSTHPANRGQFVLQQQVVGLVVEAPLAQY